MQKACRVDFVVGQGGGGHYATYSALSAAVQAAGLPWDIQVTDMDEIITALSQSGQVKNAYESVGISGHDLYNLMVKRGWTWLWPLKMRLNKWLVRLNYEIGVEQFTQHWQRRQPDLVVSLMPLYNKGLRESLHHACPGVPYITVLTDFADCPPNFWFEPEIDASWVCGSQRAAQQARSLGIDPTCIIRTSGLVIHPKCYSEEFTYPDKQRQLREELNLEKSCPTGLVMFGGNGSQEMLTVAKKLENLGSSAQFIFLCGNNSSLRQRLQRYDGPQKRAVIGYTNNVVQYMGISDFFIGKPGNVSVSEAVAMQLPVITVCNFATMSQERYCAQWISENRVGQVIRSFSQVDKAVENLLKPETLATYRSALSRIDNRAVFEVLALLKSTIEPRSPVAQLSNKFS